MSSSWKLIGLTIKLPWLYYLTVLAFLQVFINEEKKKLKFYIQLEFDSWIHSENIEIGART